jgi:hypothetical protein
MTMKDERYKEIYTPPGIIRVLLGCLVLVVLAVIILLRWLL